MTDASSTSMDQTEDREDEQEMDRESQRLVLPEDGYEWKKYGQKFIKSIGQFRSYFKCQRENCAAKKRAEWSNPRSGDMKISYEGVHTHGSMTDQNSASGSSQGTSSENVNQYNLLNQVLRKDHHHQSTSHRRPHN